MVGSAVLGAATGTGLALVVAMTIVVYRYYAHKKYGKEWSDLERFSESKSSYKKNTGYSITQKAPEKAVANDLPSSVDTAVGNIGLSVLLCTFSLFNFTPF